MIIWTTPEIYNPGLEPSLTSTMELFEIVKGYSTTKLFFAIK